MKRILVMKQSGMAIMAAIVLAASAQAQCNTVAETSDGAWTNHMVFGNIVGPANPGTAINWPGQKCATKFVASGSHTICTAELRLFSYYGVHTTNYAYSIRAAVYSDSGGTPGSLVGTASDSVAATNVATLPLNATAAQWETTGVTLFTNMSASLTSGTTYWLMLEPTAALGAVDYPVHWKATGNTVSNMVNYISGAPQFYHATGRFRLFR
jgi:hypothetical protein